MTVYGPRCQVHDDRTGPVKTQGPNRLFVLHTSEGGESTDAAEQLCSFLGTPGDRVVPGSDPPRMFGASYHYLLDTNRVLPAVEENVVAYAAAGANQDGIHACFPGKAGQTRAQWLDINSRAMIGQCAELMFDRMPKLGIPFNRLTVAEVVAGEWGYCDHWTITRAYGLSDHTDVGLNFPWDVLAELLEDEHMRFEFFAQSGKHHYDSRLPAPGKKLAAGEERVIPLPNCADGTRPAGATVTMTVTEPEAPGFLSIFPNTNDGSSCVNFVAGQTIANTTSVQAASNGTFKVTSPRTATHVVIDVVGLYHA